MKKTRMFMKLILPIYLLANVFWIMVSCTQDQRVLCVGNNGKGCEESYATIGEAIEGVKKLRDKGMGGPITIAIAEGDYYLDKFVQITSDMAPLSIHGADSEKTILKGSFPIEANWKQNNDSIWETELSGLPDFDQLIVNGEPQILARYPNYDENGGYWQGHAADVIAPERVKSWDNPKDAIVHVMHSGEWGGFHYRVTGVDTNGKPILEGGHQNNRPSPMHPEYRMVENVLEELDMPGEWFATKDKLYFYPPKSIDLQNAVIEVTTLKKLVDIKGNGNKPVKDISVEGIHFKHTRRTLFEKYEPLLRSDWTIYRGGAIFVENAENITIKDCEFSHLGGNVIFVSDYARDVKVVGNHIHDCGASGICFVGSADAVRSPSFQYGEFVPMEEMDTVRGPKTEAYPMNCLASDNLIYRIGRVEKQTAGVQIAMAAKITVSKNSIYEVPRAGINIGDGTWGGHVIEYNDVFKTVLESGDHGAFNSWGRDRFWHPDRKVMDSLTAARPDMPEWDAVYTTILRNNRFRCDHGWDIDLDDGSSNYHIYNNLCLSGGLKLREGFNRTVNNNIMLNNGFHPHVWFKNSGDVFRNNIVFTEHKDILLNSWGKEVDHNFFVDGEDLEKSHKKGVDIHSITGNVGFVDAKNGNFNLLDSSDPLPLGFDNVKFEGYGVQRPELKKIAKQPNIPILLIGDSGVSEGVGTFLEAQVKVIQSMEERSAIGLTETAGLIILELEESSPLYISGLREGDAILSVEGDTIRSITQAQKIYQGNRWKGEIEVEVIRNQETMKLSIKL